jgi:hypothetical protein
MVCTDADTPWASEASRMRTETITMKPCPDGNHEHGLIHADAATAGHLGLPVGSLLHVDRRRRPATGDVVLVEMDLHDRLARTLRRFTDVGDVVSLERIDGQPGCVIRPRFEVGVLGVVDGHVAPLAET